MSARRVAIPLLLALAAPLARAGAQQDAASARLDLVRIPEGTLVRATLRSTAVERGVPLMREAHVVWMRDDSVRLAWTRQLDARTLAWRDLAALDTAAGREGSGRNTRRGALVGGGVGLAVGALTILFSASLCEPEADCLTPGQFVTAGLLGALGAGVGAGIGSTIPGGTRWARVAPLPPRVPSQAQRTIAAAPAPVQLAPGTRVRVHVEGDTTPRRGRVGRLDADALLLVDPRPPGTVTPVPWSRIVRLDTLGREPVGLGPATLVATLAAAAAFYGVSEMAVDLGPTGIVSGGILFGVLSGPFVRHALPGTARWCRVAEVGTPRPSGCRGAR